ncbi:hypothetical protein [Kitasatospora sp. NPDC088351]|uniref:WXG100 family type VII secretion target n=1 Tax=Kitasatospora sp. NPDC088351 TaxID=3155180 RepID=UPI00342F181A
MNYTDFGAYSHGQLRKMAEALNPGEVMAASDPWRRAADTLKAIRTTLTRASTEAAVSWEGSTSDAFHARMLQLAATINNTAAYANDAAITLKAMSEAIAKAKRDMPEEPSGWDQFKDGVGDTVSSLFGGDDEDTKTAVVEQKKAEAVAVMQTLAMHYRVATPMLKPPPPPSSSSSTQPVRNEDRDMAGTGDPGGLAAAFGAMVTSATVSSTGSRPTTTNSPLPRTRSTVDESGPKRSGTPVAAASAEPGIKGGTAQAAPRTPSVANVGPGTGIDGAVTTTPTTSGAGSGTSVVKGSGSVLGSPSGAVTGDVFHVGAAGPISGRPGGLGGEQGKSSEFGEDTLGRENAAGRPVTGGGRAFGAGETHEGGFGSGARGGLGVRAGGGLPGRAGSGGGEGNRPAVGQGEKQGFTEGGSGLGARNRARSELNANTAGIAGGMGPGMPVGGSQRRKKDGERGGKRPEYLVEDERTWASEKPVNPNVVE